MELDSSIESPQTSMGHASREMRAQGITRRAREVFEVGQEAEPAVELQRLSVKAMGLAAGGKLSMYLLCLASII